MHGRFHEGRAVSHDNFGKRYWFPFCKVYFEEYMIHCQVCELKKFKIRRYNRKPPCVVLVEENPLDRIQVDLLTVTANLKEEGCKYHYILDVIDHHSKKVWAKPLKNKKQDQVAHVLDKFFSKIFAEKGHYPKLVHTDMGTYFRNEHLQNVCTFKGIRLLHGAPFHSQSQGLIERFNRVLLE